MNSDQLKIGTMLKSRTESKVTRRIEAYAPATPLAVQQWQVNGNWLNYAQLDARYQLHKPKGAAPSLPVLTAK